MRSICAANWRILYCTLAFFSVLIANPAFPATVQAKTVPAITLDPSAGIAGTQIHVDGNNFPQLCTGIVTINPAQIIGQYSCGTGTSFHITVVWPTGLKADKYTITAEGFFYSAKAAFTQLTPTPTPDLAATATTQSIAATATGQSIATTATVVAANATATYAAQATATATALSAQNPFDAGNISLFGVIAFAIVFLALGSLVTAIIMRLAMRGRQQNRTPSPYTGYPPPPPSPSNDPYRPDVTQNDSPTQEAGPWIWPRDPYQ